jgi:hypothetical protein
MNYSDFAQKHGITMTYEARVGRADIDSWPRGTSHWTIKIKGPGGTMTTIYSMGPAHTGRPVLDDVLSCLALDASTAEQCNSAADLVVELGPIKNAGRMYRALVQSREKLVRILGLDLLAELYTCEE